MSPPLSSGAKLLPIISLLVLAHLVGAPPPPPRHRVLPGTTGGAGGTTDTTGSATSDTSTSSSVDVGTILDVINSATINEVSAVHSMRDTVVLDVNNAESTLDGSISDQESYLSGRIRALLEATSCNTTTANNASSGILPVMGIEVR